MDKTPQPNSKSVLDIFEFTPESAVVSKTPLSITPVTRVTSDVRKRLNLNNSSGKNKKVKKDTTVECTPKSKTISVKPKGSLDFRTFDFTPISHKSNSGNIPTITPTSSKGLDIRKRLDLLEINPSDVQEMKSCMTELEKINDLPNCLCAIGCLLDKGVYKEECRSNILKEMPEFFGYYKGSNCAKSFDRIRKHLLNLQCGFKSVARSSFINSLEKHQSLKSFKKGEICTICNVNNASDKESENFSEFKNSIVKFYESQINFGKTMYDAYSQISKYNDSVLSEIFARDNSSQSPEMRTMSIKSIESLKADSSKIRENLESFQKNLDSHAARLYYATPIPHGQIIAMDQKLYCKPKCEDKSIGEIVKSLPNFKSIKCSVPDLNFELLFAEYEEHIKEFGYEKKRFFSSLGDKYQLKGARGGSSRQCLLAQTVVINMIQQIQLTDPNRYKRLFHEFSLGFLKRARFEQFDINNELKFPRLPRKKVALEYIDSLVRDNKILIGQSQISQKVKSTHPVSGEIVEIEIASRNVSFDDLRECTLQKHKKYLRASEPSFYENLTKESILKMLDDYGILDKHHESMEETELQNIIQMLETKRDIGIWYDHSTVGNRSHILFTFQIVYNKATFKCPPGMDIDDMQKDIETPEIYTLGISQATTDSERSFDEMRLNDLLTVSVPITFNGITFQDNFRISFGDNPVRCSEMGQNKSGHYRLSSLSLQMEEFDSFKDLTSYEHLSVSDKRTIACQGNFFDDVDNSDHINLQKVNSVEYCRKVKINFVDLKDAALKHEKALCGIKSTPAMLSKHPYTDLGLLNLHKWEVLPMEVLHDLKGLVKKSFEHIPGKIHLGDDDVVKSAHEIVHKSGDELYLLKDKHSAETLAKALIDICRDLEAKFFPFGLDAPCTKCGPLLTISKIYKCIKCSLVGYYRVLCEVQLYGYKHESKRNAYDSVRLHNLIFLLFHFIKCFENSLPRFNSNKVIRCSYFVNVIYYLPIVFELHNPMSFNAGRNEDMFRQIKNIARNFTNHQHSKPQLLLNVLRRIECNRFFNGDNFSNRSSEFSRKMTYFLKKSPQPPICYTKDFVQENDDFCSLILRLSTFLVSNNGDRFVSTTQKDLFMFNYKYCICNSNDCSVCLNKNFPSFGINNILVSSISKILNVKRSVFENNIKPYIFNPNNRLIYEKLVKVVSGKVDLNRGAPIQTAKVSDKVISKASIETVSDAQIKLPKTFQNVLGQLPEIKHKDYKKLKNSFQARCLAKIYGTIDEDLIIFDRIVGSVESIQIQFRNNPDALKSSETYHEALRNYVSHIRKHIHRLHSFVKNLRNEIQSYSLEIDNTIFTVFDDESDFDVNNYELTPGSKKMIEKLTNLQKRLLAYRYTVQCLTVESNAHGHILTEFDDGLF